MFKTFINAFKVKDVRRKIFYVLMMLVVIRLGSQMPVPGVNTSFFANYFANNTNEAFSFLNAFTGGGFDRFSIFALSITRTLLLPSLFSCSPLQFHDLRKCSVTAKREERK